MKNWLFTAAICGALGVAASAMAAHARDLSPMAETDIRLGASYQLSHALAMGLAALAGRGRAKACATIAASLFLAGIVLFSGGLYLRAFTGSFVFLIPFGGAAFIAGWIALAITALKLEIL